MSTQAQSQIDQVDHTINRLIVPQTASTTSFPPQPSLGSLVENGGNLYMGNGTSFVLIGGSSPSMASSVIGWAGMSSSASAAQYFSPYGETLQMTVATADFPMPVGGTINNLFVYVGANASTSNVNVTLYKNGSATTLVAVTTALTTGSSSDLVHSVTVAQGDLIALRIDASTTSVLAEVNASVQFITA